MALAASLMLMLASAQYQTPTPPLFCTQLATIRTRPGERLHRGWGRRFENYLVTEAKRGFFYVSLGGFETGETGREKVFQRRGRTIYRLTGRYGFIGYLVTGEQGRRNLFTGSVLTGDSRDSAFFDRVRFGECPWKPIVRPVVSVSVGEFRRSEARSRRDAR